MIKYRSLVFVVILFLILIIGCAGPTHYQGMKTSEFIKSNGKPDNITVKGEYELLLYRNWVPPGTVEYWFKNDGFVREQYVPSKGPFDY